MQFTLIAAEPSAINRVVVATRTRGKQNAERKRQTPDIDSRQPRPFRRSRERFAVRRDRKEPEIGPRDGEGKNRHQNQSEKGGSGPAESGPRRQRLVEFLSIS
jgi:hypothetical protein